MEETLGKRIAAHRKRLGLTQDKLAESLGVTAQAVSKWENDQSCPDITTLPKLADIFSVTTDALLGLEPKEPRTGEIITVPGRTAPEPDGLHVHNGHFEFQWDGGRKSSVGLALWVLLSGGLLFASNYFQWDVSFFHILWTSGLTLFGLFGLYPWFSLFRLCCALLGGYFLYNEIQPISFGKDYLLPLFLVLFGASLLAKALCKPKHGTFRLTRNGKTISGTTKNHCQCDDRSFACAASFGECSYPIKIDCLEEGTAEVSFGELTVDLRLCQSVDPDGHLTLECAFGQLVLLVPRQFRIEPEYDTAFGSVNIQGEPAPNAVPLRTRCDVSFGEISIRYI